MKIGLFFEYIFDGTHCDSHFAHMCLFMMLLCLFYSFMKGVKEQLDAKDEYERRKENMMLVEKYRREQMRRHNKAPTPGQEPPGVQGLVDQKQRDISELQKEQMLKKIMIEQLSHEENNFSKYNHERDKPELNAVIHVKEDAENPVIRLDGVLEYNAR